jgi:hypothetical protein
MADNDTDLMAEFQAFLTEKQQREAANAQEEDYEVEVWNEKGQGARLRRSHAKPFLQSLGIDMDDESNSNSGKSDDGTTADKKQTGKRSTGSQSNATGSQSVARKYFVRTPASG